jgi:hypothetical protein
LFSCCIYAASFLSDIRTYPQRFDLKKYLNSVE